jgi:hypothetical protein
MINLLGAWGSDFLLIFNPLRVTKRLMGEGGEPGQPIDINSDSLWG